MVKDSQRRRGCSAGGRRMSGTGVVRAASWRVCGDRVVWDTGDDEDEEDEGEGVRAAFPNNIIVPSLAGVREGGEGKAAGVMAARTRTRRALASEHQSVSQSQRRP